MSKYIIIVFLKCLSSQPTIYYTIIDIYRVKFVGYIVFPLLAFIITHSGEPKNCGLHS